jgi:two-component system, NarL family, invasion response regulator UvrY
VVDDQAPFRFAVKAVLRRLPCFQLAGEAKSGPEAITLVDEVHPALVLMDINMPEMNGIEATRRIVAAHPDVVVFLCSTHDVTDLPPGAPTSGARAYINKEHFGADALRHLWHNRDSTPFARLLPRAPAHHRRPSSGPPALRHLASAAQHPIGAPQAAHPIAHPGSTMLRRFSPRPPASRPARFSPRPTLARPVRRPAAPH